MSFLALGSAPCSRLNAQIPAYGRAWFDVELTDETALEGAQTLSVGARTFAVFVMAGGVAEGKARYRCVAGAGGWGKTIDEKPYHNDAGVKLATVLRDAATACGETMGTMPSTVLGPHFARANDTASDLLHLLAPRAWYVDTAGTTHVGSWNSSLAGAETYVGDGARVRTDLARGVIELAVDEVENLLPGVSVDGHGPASDVEYDVDAKRVTVRVYFAHRLSRLAEARRAQLHALDPLARYRGTWEYRVVSQSGQRFNLQPVRVSSGMPDLRRVPTRGHPGIMATVALGEHVLVAFADCDPSRPNIIAHAAPDAVGWLPTLLEFGDGEDPLVRKSDLDVTVQAFDTHTHPHALGPTGTPVAPIVDIPCSSFMKGT